MHPKFSGTVGRAIIGTLVAIATFTTPVSAGPITNTPPDAFLWETTPEGVAFAALNGDRFAESYMAMVRLPAGLVSPAHTKTSAMFGIVTSGIFVHSLLGDTAPDVPLSAGSFYQIPANVPHISKCISSVECTSFLYQDGAFDFLPVKGPDVSQ